MHLIDERVTFAEMATFVQLFPEETIRRNNMQANINTWYPAGPVAHVGCICADCDTGRRRPSSQRAEARKLCLQEVIKQMTWEQLQKVRERLDTSVPEEPGQWDRWPENE